jgi:hypothetical protein
VLLGALSLGITLASQSGITIGTLKWQPVFAGGILLIIGMNALMIGVASHLYAASRKIIPDDRLTILFNRVMTLERMLALAALLLLVGIGLDALIFVRWLTKNDLGASTEGLAATAQTAIIIGANMGLGGFLTALLMDER